MKFPIGFVVVAAVTLLQTQASQAQELYRLNFRATCRALNAQGKLVNTRLTEDGLVALSVGSTALGGNGPMLLVYNASSNSIQVVSASNGAFVADVFQFEGGITNSDGRRQDRFTFMFGPNDTQAIGSAFISERIKRNSNRASIQGRVQFVLGGVPSGGSIPGGTNNVGGTNGLGGTNSNIINTNAPGASTNATTNTTTVVSTNTPGSVLTPSPPAGVLTPPTPVTTPGMVINPISETNILGGALAPTNNPPVVTTNSPSNTNTVGNTPIITPPGITPGTNGTGGAVGSMAGVTSLLEGTNSANVQICFGTFSAGQRVPVLP